MTDHPNDALAAELAGQIPGIMAAARLHGAEEVTLPVRYLPAILAALNTRPSASAEEVERVARAISACNWRPDCEIEWLDEQFNDPDMKPLYVKQAQAAIAALRAGDVR